MTDEQFTDVVERVKAALGGASSSTGGTMLPTETADEIIRIVYERNFMRSLFPSLPMGTQTVNVPSLTGSVTFHEQTLSMSEAGTAATESRNATGELVLTLKTMIANCPVGNYLIAYGVEGLLSVIRDDIGSRLAFNEASLFINGDTDTSSGYTNNINGLYNASTNVTGVSATVNDYLLMFNGLRKQAGKTVTVAGTFGLDDLRTGLNELGVYAENRDDLALIVPRNLEVQILGITELQTVDKYGPNATILNGEVGKIYGISVFATSAIATNLNATGVFDGTTTDKTVAVLCNRRSPIIGNSTVSDRRFSIDFHDEPTKDRFVLIPRQDIAFGLRYADAVCKMVGITTV